MYLHLLSRFFSLIHYRILQLFSCNRWANFVVFTFCRLANFVVFLFCFFFCNQLSKIVDFSATDWEISDFFLHSTDKFRFLYYFILFDRLGNLSKLLLLPISKFCGIFLQLIGENSAFFPLLIDKFKNIFFFLIENFFAFSCEQLVKSTLFSVVERLISHFTRNWLHFAVFPFFELENCRFFATNWSNLCFFFQEWSTNFSFFS